MPIPSFRSVSNKILNCKSLGAYSTHTLISVMIFNYPNFLIIIFVIVLVQLPVICSKCFQEIFTNSSQRNKIHMDVPTVAAS